MVEKAIEDHLITRLEYDSILSLALEDGLIDTQEKLLLDQLQDMVESKIIP